jgi:Mrp family chromosome partitioning ATPase
LVASPGAGDGKTACAVNLALALAEAPGARVLLVEANLRSPQFESLFGCKFANCFVAQLRARKSGQLRPYNVLEASLPTGRLHVLGLSAEGDRPAVLASLPVLGALRQLGEADYDHVVVDGPGVLRSADAHLLLEGSSGYILAARRHVTRGAHLSQAVERLGEDAFLGVVLFEP